MSLIARLIEAGTPADLIEEVALLVAEKRAADARRSKDAARKREERELERLAASTDIHGHPVTSGTGADIPDDPSLSPSPLPSPQTPQPTPRPHTHPEHETPRAREADPFPRPAWCSDQLWRDLKSNRKLKRLACTATAHAQLLRDIEKYTNDEWPPGRVLEAAVARGWAAVPNDPRDRENDRPTRQHPSNQRASVREIAERAVAGRSGSGDSVAQLLPGPRAASGHG